MKTKNSRDQMSQMSHPTIRIYQRKGLMAVGCLYYSNYCVLENQGFPIRKIDVEGTIHSKMTDILSISDKLE